MKLSNTEIMEKAGITPTVYYGWRKKYPNVIELLRKGVVAEQLLQEKAFDILLKTKKGAKDGFNETSYP